MGMVSSVRAAVRAIHATSASAGTARVRASLGKWLGWAGDANPGKRASATAAENYIDVVDVCAAWHSTSPLAFRSWEMKGIIRFNPTDVLDVVVRVVLEDATGKIWGRLIYWDGPRLPLGAAELLAAAAIEVLDARFPPADVAGVEVWQCRTKERHTIAASTARAQRGRLAAHVAAM
jgi:hypothetical protein